MLKYVVVIYQCGRCTVVTVKNPEVICVVVDAAGEKGDPAERVLLDRYKGDRGLPGAPGEPGLAGLPGSTGKYVVQL